MLIEYKQMHMVMMAMVTVVEHLAIEVSEVEVMVCMEEDVVKLFVTIVISQDIMQEIVRIQLRHVNIVKQ